MANAANLKCSIVEMVGRVGNKVGGVVTNFDMVVGPLVFQGGLLDVSPVSPLLYMACNLGNYGKLSIGCSSIHM